MNQKRCRFLNCSGGRIMTDLLRGVITDLLQNGHFSVKNLKYLILHQQAIYLEYSLSSQCNTLYIQTFY